ncbi:MAG: radical SAM protein [Clostridia bacterium]|nr:radical SAM protein [Clostridia bacterium]
MNKYATTILNAERCNVCPRNCNVNRTTTVGFCGAPNIAVVSKIMVHNYEEPIISNIFEDKPTTGKKGCGAIFFSGCNLKCLYCQNYEISNSCSGTKFTSKELANEIKKLEAQNVACIDLVTPTHFVKQIIEALNIYKPKIPIVYNTSGYEKVETIKALEGYVDIFLFDFKYTSKVIAKEYSMAQNYPEICKNALLEAKKLIKNDVFEGRLLKKGIIIRHLLLPNNAKEGIEILDFIYSNLGKDSIVSLMNQYVPMGKAPHHPVLKNKTKKLEYKLLVSHAKKLDMPNVFIQDEESASSYYTPDFSSLY